MVLRTNVSMSFSRKTKTMVANKRVVATSSSVYSKKVRSLAAVCRGSCDPHRMTRSVQYTAVSSGFDSRSCHIFDTRRALSRILERCNKDNYRFEYSRDCFVYIECQPQILYTKICQISVINFQYNVGIMNKINRDIGTYLRFKLVEICG